METPFDERIICQAHEGVKGNFLKAECALNHVGFRAALHSTQCRAECGRKDKERYIEEGTASIFSLFIRVPFYFFLGLACSFSATVRTVFAYTLLWL